VNDDANSQNNYQWHPAMWCDKSTGRLHVNWMDTRNSPTSDTAEIWGTYSTNGGVSFVTNQMISNGRMKLTASPAAEENTALPGDYNSVVKFSNGDARWTDFRGLQLCRLFSDCAVKYRPNLDTLRNRGYSYFLGQHSVS
jgi:hypothetical protein